MEMSRFSRRALLQSSAIVAAPLFPAFGGPDMRRNLLTKAWPVDRVAKVLIPRDRFRPFPAAGERGAWEALPADARAALVQDAEKQLKTRWETLPATLALEFKRNGNRSRYEAVRDRRRKKLQDLVIAECIEGKGRFIDEIANGVWLTCEESFWGVPAHLGAQKAGIGLPDVAEPIVDLFAAETASLLSWTAYLLAPQLAGVSKLIPERIRVETDRRLLTPCLTRDDFSWMGFSGKAVNNWNPWISSNWLTTALLQETDERRRQAAVQKILRCVDNFMNGYADDGGCDEGPGYWGRAGASLFDCLELLHSASDGALNGFSQPLVREIGLSICRAHVYNEWYTNFADAPARVEVNGDLVYRFGQRVQNETMMRMARSARSCKMRMQAAGREFAASDVAYRSDAAAAEFRLNLAHAYPKEANLEAWNRTLRLDRARNEIEIVDDWRLKRAARAITLTLMTPCQVTQKGLASSRWR